MPRTVIAAYIPVLHKGYLDFIRQADAAKVYLFDQELLNESDYLYKDLRAVPPRDMRSILATALDMPVEVLTKSKLVTAAGRGWHWVLPDEDVAHQLAKKYLKGATVTFVPVFLRWDRGSVKGVAQHSDQVPVSEASQDARRMRQAYQQTSRSPDIWRRVGAVVYDRQGSLIDKACNMPAINQHTPIAEGDPRNVSTMGADIDISLFLHAESALIARAAQKGRSLKGAVMYVTTFPCPLCAKLIAHSGVSKVYYTEGYAVLDGLDVLQANHIQVIRVPIDVPPTDPRQSVPYKKP